jgi:hypothetical protein
VGTGTGAEEPGAAVTVVPKTTPASVVVTAAVGVVVVVEIADAGDEPLGTGILKDVEGAV